MKNKAMIDHDFHAHDNEKDKALWNSLKPAKPRAIMVVCPGVINDDLFGHSMRDYCSSCGPYWEQYPTCPTHGGKLRESKRGFWCSKCRKYYAQGVRLDLRVESIKRVVGKPNLIDGAKND